METKELLQEIIDALRMSNEYDARATLPFLPNNIAMDLLEYLDADDIEGALEYAETIINLF